MSEIPVEAETLLWGHDALSLAFHLRASEPARLEWVSARGTSPMVIPPGLPLMDVLIMSAGHALASGRLVHTAVGEDLVYVSSETSEDASATHLTITAVDTSRDIEVRMLLTSPWGVPAFTSRLEVRNLGAQKSVVLRSIPSWSSYAGHSSNTLPDPKKWILTHGYSDWLAEGRWAPQPLGILHLPDEASWITGHNSRGALAFTSEGTWSSGKHVPVGFLSSVTDAFTWAWQIEHNGGWRFELGRDLPDAYFAVSGPTDTDHQWTHELHPGETFVTVPATMALGIDIETATCALTEYRRAARKRRADSSNLPVVFNDYMNTLNGDPTSDKLTPLITAAADVGAEIFCIDAGWYDDTSDWWDSVGEWRPSTTRFTHGLAGVIKQIRDLDMTPGLWLEPEVVGVKSAMADHLPIEAFFCRNGQRVVEQGRYHLDLRHPAAVAHLDSVIDRLVDEFKVGYFKLDYNINPGAGTTLQTDSIGDGLLEHNRAHQTWIDSLYVRHPGLVLENCASGAMRMDFALLSRMDLQSTSDQQDLLLYPPIAAAAPLAMLPEQAANWAYPQPEYSDEQNAFTLTTGLAGRLYLSGRVDGMTPEQRDVVREVVGIAQSTRSTLVRSSPYWPLGLPEWSADWVALGLSSGQTEQLMVWCRHADPSEATLELPHLAGKHLDIHTLFPSHLETWPTCWDPATGTLHVTKTTHEVGARVLRITVSS